MGAEWFALLIPSVALSGAAAFRGARLAWWEYLVIYPPVLLFLLACKGCAETELTRDTEYWGSYVTHVRHESAWQEEVSCRHPIYCQRPVTRTRIVSDGKGGTTTETYVELESYVCGYEHLYDVDDHPPIWVAYGSGKERFSVTAADWERHCQRFGNKTEVATGHTSVHGQDGQAWETHWPGTRATVDPLFSEHAYTNRIQASKNVYNYEPPDKQTIEQLGLYPYPKVRGYYLPSVLPAARYAGDEQLAQLNGMLGKKKQVRVWLLVYPGMPRAAGLAQEALWQGGNKNELCITVGIDKERRIRWAHVFSWTPVEAVKIETRAWLEGQERLDIPALVDFLQPLLEQKWQRRPFAEFSYLRVEMTAAQLAWLYGFTLLLTATYLYWALSNDQQAYLPRWSRYFWKGDF